VVSVEEARKLVDELFNPIVAYDCDESHDESYKNLNEKLDSIGSNGYQECVYGNSYSYDSNNNDSHNISNNLNNLHSSRKYSPLVRTARSELSLDSGNGSKIVATRIATNNNPISNVSNNFNNNAAHNTHETSYSSSAKLYYAFDNFEDLRRRRKSLMPDFYGGGISGGSDSAYESSPSYESLKSLGDSNQKLKKKSKYFTLPTEGKDHNRNYFWVLYHLKKFESNLCI